MTPKRPGLRRKAAGDERGSSLKGDGEAGDTRYQGRTVIPTIVHPVPSDPFYLHDEISISGKENASEIIPSTASVASPRFLITRGDFVADLNAAPSGFPLNPPDPTNDVSSG